MASEEVFLDVIPETDLPSFAVNPPNRPSNNPPRLNPKLGNSIPLPKSSLPREISPVLAVMLNPPMFMEASKSKPEISPTDNPKFAPPNFNLLRKSAREILPVEIPPERPLISAPASNRPPAIPPILTPKSTKESLLTPILPSTPLIEPTLAPALIPPSFKKPLTSTPVIFPTVADNDPPSNEKRPLIPPKCDDPLPDEPWILFVSLEKFKKSPCDPPPLSLPISIRPTDELDPIEKLPEPEDVPPPTPEEAPPPEPFDPGPEEPPLPPI